MGEVIRFLFKRVPAGRLFGIPVLIMPAVVVLTLALLALAGHRAGTEGLGWMLAMLAILAGSLLAHELGHALVARRLKVHVVDITIWPLGGMARIQNMASRPGLEALIALGGPLVNLILAGGLALIPGPWTDRALWVNLVLGLGNLVPAFPLDGGRILRAWLALRSPLVDATRAAVSIANLVTMALLIVAFLQEAFLLGLLLAGYIFLFGYRELMETILRTQRMPSMPLSKVLRRALRWEAGEPPAESPMQPPDESELDPRAKDLEDFRGSLKEYFQHRKSQ